MSSQEQEPQWPSDDSDTASDGGATAWVPVAGNAADGQKKSSDEDPGEPKAPEKAAEERKVPEKAAEERKTPDKAAEAQTVAVERAEQRKAPEKAAEEQKVPEKAAEGQKVFAEAAEEHKASEKPAGEQKVSDKAAETQKPSPDAAGEKAPQKAAGAPDEVAGAQTVAVERAEQRKAPEKAAEEQKVPDKPAGERKASEKTADEQKVPDKAAEAQKTAEKAAEEQKIPDRTPNEPKTPDKADHDQTVAPDKTAGERTVVVKAVEERKAPEDASGERTVAIPAKTVKAQEPNKVSAERKAPAQAGEGQKVPQKAAEGQKAPEDASGERTVTVPPVEDRKASARPVGEQTVIVPAKTVDEQKRPDEPAEDQSAFPAKEADTEWVRYPQQPPSRPPSPSSETQLARSERPESETPTREVPGQQHQPDAPTKRSFPATGPQPRPGPQPPGSGPQPPSQQPAPASQPFGQRPPQPPQSQPPWPQQPSWPAQPPQAAQPPQFQQPWPPPALPQQVPPQVPHQIPSASRAIAPPVRIEPADPNLGDGAEQDGAAQITTEAAVGAAAGTAQPTATALSKLRGRRGLVLGGIALLLVLVLGGVSAVPAVSNRLGLPWAPNLPKSDPPEPVPVTLALKAPSPSAASPTNSGVEAALQGPAGSPALGMLTGIVLDPATGSVLWDRNSNQPLTPASATKLLTSAAALLALDHNTQLSTKVVAGDTPGTVVLVPGGDPTLSALPAGQASVYPGAAHLDDLVAQVKQSGVPVNSVQIDNSLFSGATTAPGWEPGDAPQYVAQIQPGMLDGGLQDPANEHSPHVDDPSGTLLNEFSRRLGASVAGPGTAPKGGKVLGEVRSAPITELIDTLLQLSDNTLAEAVGRQTAIATGAPPTFAGVAQATRNVLSQNGFDLTGVQLSDGSGLSTLNKVPARLLAQLLSVAAAPDGKDPRTAKLRPLLQGLPVAGGSGTLSSRFDDPSSSAGKGWVRAKTGTLSGVNTLAGVVLDSDGRVLVFALMSNGSAQEPGRAALDAVAAALRGCGCR